jgi:hypothetical protein
MDAPEEGVAPGQACVFYTLDDAHSRVLGGGWIWRAESDYDPAAHPVSTSVRVHAEETL